MAIKINKQIGVPESVFVVSYNLEGEFFHCHNHRLFWKLKSAKSFAKRQNTRRTNSAFINEFKVKIK